MIKHIIDVRTKEHWTIWGAQLMTEKVKGEKEDLKATGEHYEKKL